MTFVYDTNIISTFLKIGKITLLIDVFETPLTIPKAVLEDLKKSRDLLIKAFITSPLFMVISLSDEEQRLVDHILQTKTLGHGESECIAVCKKREFVLVTNDSKAKKYAKDMGIQVVDLMAILYALKDSIPRHELEQLIEDIETKDRVKIVNKEKILA